MIVFLLKIAFKFDKLFPKYIGCFKLLDLLPVSEIYGTLRMRKYF